MFVYLQHHVKHMLYFDVGMPPEALEMIQEDTDGQPLQLWRERFSQNTLR